jgi:hypothetical protein
MISGTLAQVSTLFSTVGRPQSPSSTERTYLGRGLPGLPSIEVNRAVDSPHTKGAGAAVDARIEGKPGIENVVAQQPVGSGLGHGDFQVADGQRVFRAHIQISFFRTQA